MSDVGIARFYCPYPLAKDAQAPLTEAQAHQLFRVLRAEPGNRLTLFNTESGEWDAEIVRLDKRSAEARCLTQRRAPRLPPDHWLVFTPIKGDRIADIVEKATELGVRAVLPVTTRRTVVSRINAGKLEAVAREAAEQTERFDIPEIRPLASLDAVLAAWDPQRILIVADESGGGAPVYEALPAHRGKPAAVLIGPEGGFDPAELERLKRLAYVVSVSLGPRVLRADTAAIAALTCLQLYLGDWDERPSFSSGAA